MKRAERKRLLGRKFYTNKPEDLAAQQIEKHGLTFTKRGYPDFTVYNKDGSIYGFVEVKPHRNSDLKTHQSVFAEFCQERDIPFLLWTPDSPDDEMEKFLSR